MKMEMKGMSSIPEMEIDTGVKHNPPKRYDFLLREDTARTTLATDSMMLKERPFPPHKMLRPVKNTSFPKSATRQDFRLTLDGDMNRYVGLTFRF